MSPALIFELSNADADVSEPEPLTRETEPLTIVVSAVLFPSVCKVTLSALREAPEVLISVFPPVFVSNFIAPISTPEILSCSDSDSATLFNFERILILSAFMLPPVAPALVFPAAFADIFVNAPCANPRLAFLPATEAVTVAVSSVIV